MFLRTSLFRLLLAGIMSATACRHGNIIDRVDQTVDCGNICNRYKDCFNSSYDDGACRTRCEALISSQPRAADRCVSCLSGRSCSGSIFPCSSECNSIIP